MTNVIGADVSFYADDDETPQGIDFDKMDEKADFVIIRAGQNSWIDPDFTDNWKAAKEAGLPRGSYWFYDSRNEPQEQARLWSDALDGDAGELPLFLDFEESYGGAWAGYNKWWAFSEYVKEEIPQKANHLMLYTGYYYWKENTGGMPQSLKDYFGAMPLWIARYKADYPLIPEPWSEDEWLLWQYTETGDGLSYGVESLGIDLNYFMINKNQILQREDKASHPGWQWFTDGYDVPDQPEEPGEPETVKATVVAGIGSNLRLSPEVEEKTTYDNRIGAAWSGRRLLLKPPFLGNDGREWAELAETYVCTKGLNGEIYVEVDAEDQPDPEPDPDENGWTFYNPVDVPKRAFYVRHAGGFDTTPIYADPYGREHIGESLESAIFVGTELSGRFMKLAYNNGVKVSGSQWIDYTDSKMIPLVEIPEETLRSRIPYARDPLKIHRTHTAPDKDSLYLRLKNSKNYKKLTVPMTVTVWTDNKQQPVYMPTTANFHKTYFELLKLASPEQPILQYVAWYVYQTARNRWRTDYSGTNKHRDDLMDAVLGTHEGKQGWYLKVGTFTRGNFLPIKTWVDGKAMLDGVDMDNIPPATEIWGNSKLMGFCTQESPKVLSNGIPKVKHFGTCRNWVDDDGDGVYLFEPTGTPYLNIAPDYPVNLHSEVEMLWAEHGRDYPIVNLQRDYQ